MTSTKKGLRHRNKKFKKKLDDGKTFCDERLAEIR